MSEIPYSKVPFKLIANSLKIKSVWSVIVALGANGKTDVVQKDVMGDLSYRNSLKYHEEYKKLD